MIHESLHTYKNQYFGYYHESKRQYFLSFHEYKHQDFDNIAESIFWKLKRIVSHEGLNIVSNHNDKVYWYNVMVILGSGGTTTESLNIIIGVKP